MKCNRLFSVLVLLFFYVSAALADSPQGSWTTFDDKTGEKRAVVRLSILDGVLSGKILKVYPKPGDRGICAKCPGQFKDKPIEGLRFVWGLREHGDGMWAGGRILDPKTGKIYHVKLSVKGDKLYVRGYVGMSMLGRTQIWRRG